MGVFRLVIVLVCLAGAANAQLYPLPPYTPGNPVVGPAAPTVVGNLLGWANTSGTSATDTGIASSNVVLGPGVTALNHVAVWGNALGTKLVDGGAIGVSGPIATVCGAKMFVIGYPSLGAALTCSQPSTNSLSDIGTFSLSTTGTVTAASLMTSGSVTGAGATLTGGVTAASLTLSGPLTVTVSSGPMLALNNSLGAAFAVDALGIPTIPAVTPGTYPTQLIWNGPQGSHLAPQEWFKVRGATGVIRYVPGF